MPRKTNCVDKNGNKRYRLQKKVGMRKNKHGDWVPQIKNFYGRCKQEAEEKYVEYCNAQASGQANNKFRCLGEAIDMYAENVFKKLSIANSTKQKYLNAYKKLFQNTPLSGRPLNEVTSIDLQKFYNNLDQCESTRRALHNFLRLFYKYADQNNICSDITSCLVVPKGCHEPKNEEIDVWDNEEIQRVIDALDGSPLRLLIVLAVNTGARISELLALTYEDVSDNTMTINKQLSEIASVESDGGVILHMEPVKSKNSNRTIPLTDEVMEEIEKHRQLQKRLKRKYRYDNNGFLFTTSTGKLHYKRTITRSLERLYRRIGVKHHKFHAYRHTFGTNLSKAGVPIEVVSILMGHSSIDITAKYYINVDAERRRTAIEKIVSMTLTKKSAEEADTNDKTTC